MSLQNLSGVGHGGAGLNDRLPTAVKELQSEQTVIVNGAAANTSIAIPGLLANGTIRSAVAFNAGVPTPVTASAGNLDGLIGSVGNLKVNEVTTGWKIVVTFVNKVA